MAKLTEAQKLFIVKALACFDTPTQVSVAVKEEFGIAVDRRQVAEYDAAKASGREVSKKLRAIFEQTRKAFLEDVSTLPIANQAYRLRTLQRLVNRVEAQGNAALVGQLLEQAAKEVGGALTNRRELSGRDGKPIEVARKLPELSDDELLAIAAGGGT